MPVLKNRDTKNIIKREGTTNRRISRKKENGTKIK